MINEQETMTRLETLGFKAASEKIKAAAVMKKKLAVAYEHYRFVREEKIADFQHKLYSESRKNGSYKELAFTPIESYSEVPPTEVLSDLETAMERKCFDTFEIAHIREVKDPILFGRIGGCSDRFYIAQWDEDVKIEQILGPNEG